MQFGNGFTVQTLLKKALELIHHAYEEQDVVVAIQHLETAERMLVHCADEVKKIPEESKQEIEVIVQRNLEYVRSAISVLKDTPNQMNVKSRDSALETASGPSSCNQSVSLGKILFEAEGVSLYYNTEGTTSYLVENANLQLIMTDEGQNNSSVPLYFFQIGEYFLPLSAAVPCLKHSSNTYVFAFSETEFYGVVFAREFNAELFERSLGAICLFRSFEEKTTAVDTTTHQAELIEATKLSEYEKDLLCIAMSKLAGGLESTSQQLSSSIVSLSENLQSYILTGGGLMIAKLRPNENPTEVNTKIRTTVTTLKRISPGVVYISQGLVNTMEAVADKVGGVVAHMMVGKSTPSARKEAVKQLGRAGVKSLVHIWETLEEAGTQIIKTTADTTTTVTRHKYGDELGDVVRDSLDVTGDLATSAYSTRMIFGGAKKVALSLAVQSSKSTVSHVVKLNQPPTPLTQQLPASTATPYQITN